MKLQELINQLQDIEIAHPDTNVCFETVDLRPLSEETMRHYVVDISYGRDQSDYCTIRVSSRPRIEPEP
jgi:hypothetical protein